MFLKIAVCDDDKPILATVKAVIVSAFDSHGIKCEVSAFKSAEEMERVAARAEFNLAFLDIDMGNGMTGIEYAKKLRNRDLSPDIIFISGREDKVFESFSVQPFGFIRKGKFLEDVSNVIALYVKIKAGSENGGKNIVFPAHGGEISVAIQDIVFIEGSGVYQQVHMKNKTVCEIVSRMQTLEEKLKEYGFMRIHKGYLVNYHYIARIGTAEILLNGGLTLPISRRKSKDIREEFLSCGRKFGALTM